MSKKNLIKKINETKSQLAKLREGQTPTYGLAVLMESELDKAELVLAVKGISDELQNVAEKVAKIEVEDIMPILDSLKAAFGPDMTSKFSSVATENLRSLVTSIQTTKDAIGNEILRLEGAAGGDVSNDMMADSPEPETDIPTDDLDSSDDLDMSDDLDVSDETTFDPDAGIDGNPDDFQDPAAGRARKESAEFRKASRPDQYVFEAVVKRIRSGMSGPDAANAVAENLNLDLSDVVEIVTETKNAKNSQITESEEIKNINTKAEGDHGFVAGFNDRKVGIYATSLYAAKKLAITHFKPKKSQEHMIWVTLAEKPDGTTVNQSTY